LEKFTLQPPQLKGSVSTFTHFPWQQFGLLLSRQTLPQAPQFRGSLPLTLTHPCGHSVGRSGGQTQLPF
jgi:hypothetical protein